MKTLAYALMIAGACWLLSEGLEIVMGGRTGPTLWLTAAFHLLMVPGIWGAYAGQGDERSRLSLLGAGAASLGFLLLVYPPIAVLQMPGMTIGEFMQSRPLFGLAGMLAVLGTVAFGVSALRQQSYPRWVGMVLIVSPLTFTAVMLAGGPDLLGIAANLVESVALIAMGGYALRRWQLGARPVTA